MTFIKNLLRKINIIYKYHLTASNLFLTHSIHRLRLKSPKVRPTTDPTSVIIMKFWSNTILNSLPQDFLISFY